MILPGELTDSRSHGGETYMILKVFVAFFDKIDPDSRMFVFCQTLIKKRKSGL
jgi:hypothetical protein